jgi:hypothetical protein
MSWRPPASSRAPWGSSRTIRSCCGAPSALPAACGTSRRRSRPVSIRRRSPADDADEEAGERYEDLFLERPNYSVIETADYLPQFVGKPPNFAPGEGCRYCNVGYVLLGLMIERATGSSYRSHVAEHAFAPAGMNRSAFFRTWSNRMSPRASKRSRTRTVASLDGAATSTPTPRSVDPTAAPTSLSGTSCASTGP